MQGVRPVLSGCSSFQCRLSGLYVLTILTDRTEMKPLSFNERGFIFICDQDPEGCMASMHRFLRTSLRSKDAQESCILALVNISIQKEGLSQNEL